MSLRSVIKHIRRNIDPTRTCIHTKSNKVSKVCVQYQKVSSVSHTVRIRLFFQPNVLEIHFFYLFLSNIFISHLKSSSKKLGVLSLTYNKNSSEKVKKKQ